MKILIMTVITALALPFMALGQTTDPQQTDTQTKETQPKAPAKGKKKHVQEPSKTQAKPETTTDARGQTEVKGRAQDVNRTETGARSSSQTTVNKQEFKSRHSEVFSLGRHPKEFFIQRFGASHFRLIGSTYFVFVDTCWVAVDVDGFVYTERVICPGDPDYIVIE
jgi:hypothetical protein